MTLAPDRAVDDRPIAGCPRRRPAPPPPGPSTGPSPGPEPPPRLAEDVELLGTYAGTGYQDEQYLARRGGGQLVQLSQLLHLVAERCDGAAPYEQIADGVSAAYGRTVSAENVRTLVETRLRPLGVLAAADGTSPPVEQSDPLLGLKLRAQLLSPHAVQTVARLARPMFWPPVVLAVLGGVVAVDVWLFFLHGVGQGLRSTVQQPLVFLLVAAVIVVAAALHELGHAAACSYGGARPGGMGAGIYVVWPAFYTDVTEAYRLDRRGRLRTDLGGVHVNAMAVLATAGAYAVTGYEPLVLLCFLLQIQVLQQMLPFLRLDGYYVLSDLVGVPDLFRRIGPVLRSSLPFRPREPEVEELKPWVRRVVAGWVFLLVPLLAVNLGYFLLAAPRIVATSWDSAAGFVGQIVTAGGGQAVFAAVQLLLLVLPTVGLTYTAVRIARRALTASWRWSAGSGGRRALVLGALAAAVAVLGVAWWPDGRLAPYREGERGTVQQSLRELSVAGSGRPLLRSPRDAREPLPAVPEGTSAVAPDDGGAAPARTRPAPGASPAPRGSAEPSAEPSTEPSAEPSTEPSAEPSAEPSPSLSPSSGPTAEPSPAEPSASSAPRASATPSAG